MSAAFKNFIGTSNLKRTIRNELIPTEITKRNIEKYGVISDDKRRYDNRQKLIPVLDCYFRDYIDEKTSTLHDIDWVPVFEKMELAAKKTDDVKIKETRLKEAVKAQADIRKEIVKHLKDDPVYTDMLKAGKMIEDILPEYVRKNIYSEKYREEISELLEEFDGFTSSLTNYFTARKNLFSTGDENTAIAHRIVNDNMTIFMRNVISFRKMLDNIDEAAIADLRTRMVHAYDMTLYEIFSYENYGKFVSQKGIATYNDICGNVNSFVNQYYQKNKDCKGKIKMKTLYKQILCISESRYEVPEMFDSDEAVYRNISRFLNFVESKNIVERITHLNAESYDLSNVYIVNKAFKDISCKVFGNWDAVTSGLYAYHESKVSGKVTQTKRKEIEKAVKGTVQLSITEINDIVKEYKTADRPDALAEDYITSGIALHEIKIPVYDPTVNLAGNEEKINEIKTVLDEIVNVSHWCKSFLTDDSQELVDKDLNFYNEIEDIFDTVSAIDTLYNRVRNYVTKKPYSNEKIKLYFNNTSFAAGWGRNKRFDNTAILMEKDGSYYLCALNKDNKPPKDIFDREDVQPGDYKCLLCTYWSNVNRMLPKVFFAKGDESRELYQPSDELVKVYTDYKDHDIPYTQQNIWDIIDYYKKCLKINPDWSRFDLVSKSTKEYKTIDEFANDLEPQMYKVEWTYISEEEVDRLQENGQMYLFKIHNKDFSEGSTGTPNLHTMYLKNLFSEENLKDVVLTLNGGAEVFFRKASVKNPIVHKKGSILVNKTYTVEEDGRTIKKFVPDEVYTEIYRKFNGINPKPLSTEAETLVNSGVIKTKVATTDIVKDNRYTYDKFFLNLVIDINSLADAKYELNSNVLEYIAKSDDMHVIGIDRGERNLIYVSVIDQKGRIVEQKSFNIINGYDYQNKLHNIEKGRQNARKEWKTISRIKDVKAGYLSLVIHEITKMIIKYNAIVVMEDLNGGFKNSRAKVERNVYQKFETALINKLSYLTFKDRDVLSDGGVLRGYQLTPCKSASGSQRGIIFYVPAAYTSKIDPTTGFSDFFVFKGMKAEGRTAFINNFDSITYDADKDMFKFSFDYKNFKTHNVDVDRTKWEVYTNNTRVKRIKENGRYTGLSDIIDITAAMKDVLNRTDINWQDGHDLRKDIIDYGLESAVIDVFKLVVQLRNSLSESEDREYDKIISPVLNAEGKFFTTDSSDNKFPCDADANGAYNIALKGLYKTIQVKNNWVDGKKISSSKLKITNKDWFKFIQNQEFAG